MKAQYKNIILIIFTLTTLSILAYIPLYNTNILKTKLSEHKKEQIQYINENIQIVPKIINTIKGHIIHDEKALKDIIKINILTKSKQKNINEIYTNQLEILHITNHLISKSNKISLLQNNQNFSELKNKFTTIYDNAIKGYINCKEYSIKLKRYIKLPIYKNIIELKDINEAFCSK